MAQRVDRFCKTKEKKNGNRFFWIQSFQHSQDNLFPALYILATISHCSPLNQQKERDKKSESMFQHKNINLNLENRSPKEGCWVFFFQGVSNIESDVLHPIKENHSI